MLRLRRREMGLKQKDVAELLELTSSQFISNFERNLCNVPFDMLRKLIKVYSIPKEVVVNVMLEGHREQIESNLYLEEDMQSSSHNYQ